MKNPRGPRSSGNASGSGLVHLGCIYHLQKVRHKPSWLQLDVNSQRRSKSCCLKRVHMAHECQAVTSDIAVCVLFPLCCRPEREMIEYSGCRRWWKMQRRRHPCCPCRQETKTAGPTLIKDTTTTSPFVSCLLSSHPNVLLFLLTWSHKKGFVGWHSLGSVPSHSIQSGGLEWQVDPEHTARPGSD